MLRYTQSGDSDEPLWRAYIRSNCTTGFLAFVQDLVPTATTVGSAARGLTLEFTNDADYAAFLLKWAYYE